MSEETFDFRSWMRSQSGPYEADFSDPDHIRLETDYAVAQVNFYDMDPDPEIVEFHIENKADGETKFFLHFHATEQDHATGLFHEMVEALTALREQQATEVLLCCTAGMTTSFFADRMNQVVQTLGLDWTFSAVSVNEVYEHGADKAAILVAPQIAYMADRIAEVMRDVPVLRIPTATFASYDAAGCVEFVRDELRRRAQETEEQAATQLTCETKSAKRVLAIAVSMDGKGARLHYRLYDHGEITLSETVIKRRVTIRDLTDIIDTQVCSCSGKVNADVVGIAVPGVVRGGWLELAPRRTHDLTLGKNTFDLGGFFSERYDIPILIVNNTNCAALGWYGSQEEAQNVVVYSQPAGWAFGGQGIVLGGHLVEGAHGLAGENKVIVDEFGFSRPLRFNAYNPADVLELVGKVLAMDVATVDPDVVCLSCSLLPNMDEVAAELDKYVPREHQPRLVRVDDYNELILLGVMVYCLEKLKAKKSQR